MERDYKGKKQSSEKKESSEKRNPLQHLNRLPAHRSNTKKISNLSSTSSAAAISGEHPKSCLTSFISSNSCSSSSSRTLVDKKSKTFPKIANNEPKKSKADTLKLLPRSKENEIPRKPFLQKSKKNHPQCLTQKKYGKNDAKPIYKSGQRSKLSSVQINAESKLKKGSQELRPKIMNSQENGSGKRANELNGSNLICDVNYTPVERVAKGYGLDSTNFGDNETVMEDLIHERSNGDSATTVNTPPVEASLSPDIQCQPHSKILVLKSPATSICYGAGHLVSGVTDKRKCRRRGSLRVGPEMVNLLDDVRSDGDVTNNVRGSLIPLLAEASIRWHLSPYNERHEDHTIDSVNKLDQCRMAFDDASGILDLLSSQSMLCGNASDFLCVESSCSGRDSVGNVATKRRNRNGVLSPTRAAEFLGCSEPLNYNIVESLLDTSPNAAYGGNGMSSRERKHSSGNLVLDTSKLLIGSLHSGNIIQTPDSDSRSREGKHFSEHLVGDASRLSIGSLHGASIIQTPDSESRSDVCVGRSRPEVHHSDFFWPVLDSITETLERVKLSPRSEMSMWDAPGLGVHFSDIASPSISVDPTQLKKNVDSVSSWVSDTTLSNLSLSQMRISWRDGLESRIVETDEFDRCCLSDEEIEADVSASDQLMLHPLTKAAEEKETYQGNNSCQRSYFVVESGENEENDLRLGNDLSPVPLDYEPCISSRGKGKSLSHRTNACAESICTDGGGLLASDDSDWPYLHENHLFQVK